MLTAVSSSVLLDAVTASPSQADVSERALRRAAEEGGLLICECVLADIRPAFANARDIERFLEDWQLRFIPSSRKSALLAGELFAQYLARGGREGRVIADFLHRRSRPTPRRSFARARSWISTRLFFSLETTRPSVRA